MDKIAKLIVDGTTYELPIVTGSEGEKAIDISSLREETGLITLDPGFANTGSCQSSITFMDGEKGILRYRGIPVEQLAEHSRFVETMYLLINGDLPTGEELDRFSAVYRYPIEHVSGHVRHWAPSWVDQPVEGESRGSQLEAPPSSPGL